jgi:hypothetical protein
MISSGLEACPWGLNGYGFDQYIADSPGNAVMALARYWHDGAHEIAAVEDKHPDRCHRVRYEEMARDPERIAAGIFDFIGVPRMPGIAQAVFARDHEQFGPADHKIWHTAKISPDSIGRSDSVPVGMIPPPVLKSVNGLLEKLGYVTVDEKWGTADMPARLLAPTGDEDEGPAISEGHVPSPEASVLADQLTAGLARVDDAFGCRWQERIKEAFTVTIRQPNSPVPVTWRVDLGDRTIIREDELPTDAPDEPADDANSGWGVVGTAQSWLEVLAGQLNLSVALRRNELRYCDFDEDDGVVAEERIALLAAFLGLPYWSGNPPSANGRVLALTEQR